MSLQAIAELDAKIQDMDDKISLIDKKAKGLQLQAKEKLKAGDKHAAKNLISKKKMLVEQINTYEGAMSMMEKQKFLLTNAQTMRSVLEAIAKTTTVIQDATKGMDVETLEKMKEEIEEMKDVQSEMTVFFSSYAESDDDAEVEDEINKLAAQLEEEDLPEVTEKKDKKKDKVIQKSQPVPALAAKGENKSIAVTTAPKKSDEKALEDFMN